MPFQKFVNTQPAPAIAGDFASRNPRIFVPAGPGGLCAGPQGLTVGLFAWLSYEYVDGDEAPAVANNYGSGPIGGFVPRQQQALIEDYLQEAGNMIPAGFPTTLNSGGDFWVMNNGNTDCLPGDVAYANYTNGEASFALPGAPGTATFTGSIAQSTATFMASIQDNVLDVTGMTSGTIQIGGLITVGAQAGSNIMQQLTGTPGGIGTYALDIGEQVVAEPIAMTETYGTLTVTNVSSGMLAVGDGPITNSPTANTVAVVGGVGTTITAMLPGTSGNTGTYIVNNSQTLASGALTTGTSVATKFVAVSGGEPGEIIKISSWPLG